MCERERALQTAVSHWAAVLSSSDAPDSPNLPRLVSSGDTGRSFLSALISSRILSWRLRGRGGVGFSFLAEALEEILMAIETCLHSCP